MAIRPGNQRVGVVGKKSATSGFEAADEAFKKSQSKFLPTLILKDEQSARCRIYDIPGANPFVYHTHSVKMGGYWRQFPCPGKGCPLCAVGNFASPTAALGIKDFRKIKYKGKDGKIRIFHNESRILTLKRTSLPLFKKLAKSGKLFSHVIEITRYGEKRDTMYHPDVVGRFTPEQLAMTFDLDIRKLLAPTDRDTLQQIAATFANPKMQDNDAVEDDDEYMSDESSGEKDEGNGDDKDEGSVCDNCGEEGCDGSCVTA